MKICAVIPAGGRGTRLGGDLPKILTPLTARDTIWSILYAKLSPLVDHIHLILSPDGATVWSVRIGGFIDAFAGRHARPRRDVDYM